MPHAFAIRSIPAHPRLAAAVVLIISATPLLVAANLRASPDGVGTHEQLGLPPCGFYSAIRIPCATCGMTTAFSHAAHGRLLTAFAVQPAGAALALVSAAAMAISAYALVVGMPLAPLGRAVTRFKPVAAAMALVLLAWIYKIVVMWAWH